jgi:hypothetical protein
MNADEIEVSQCPVCAWAVYHRRANGRHTIRYYVYSRHALRAKLRTRLEPGDTVAIVKYDREDRRTPRNNGGGKR